MGRRYEGGERVHLHLSKENREFLLAKSAQGWLITSYLEKLITDRREVEQQLEEVRRNAEAAQLESETRNVHTAKHP